MTRDKRVASSQAIDEQAEPQWRTGFAMAWRWVTAVIGGYGFAVASAMLAARLLPVASATARVEATGWPMILSFLVYAGIGLWSLHTVRLGRVTAVVWGGTLVMAVILMLWGVRP